jgi:hypothetical protein
VDPVERWIAAMRTTSGMSEGQIGARVVQLEVFCQSHDSTPGELLLSWDRSEPAGDEAVDSYLRLHAVS